jgi:hypothetical protein
MPRGREGQHRGKTLVSGARLVRPSRPGSHMLAYTEARHGDAALREANLSRVRCLLRQRPSRTPDRRLAGMHVNGGGKEAMHETDLVRCCCRAAVLDLLAG